MTFSSLCLLVENGVWGDAFWYNWKTGKVFSVPHDSTHGECLRMYGEEFGLRGDFRHGERYLIVLASGWAAVHNYSRLLMIEVGKNVSDQKVNDIVFDVLVKIGDASKPVEIHRGSEIIEFGDVNSVRYR